MPVDIMGKFGLKSLTSKVQSKEPTPEPLKKSRTDPVKKNSSKARSQSASRSHGQKYVIGDPIPPFVRQELPPHVLTELRLACAMLLKETGPSDEEYAIHDSQPDPLEQYRKDTTAIKDIREQASASQTSLTLFPNKRDSRIRDSSTSNKHQRQVARELQERRESRRQDAAKRDSTTYVPVTTVSKFPPRSDSRNYEMRSQDIEAQSRSQSRAKSEVEVQPQDQIQTQFAYRPQSQSQPQLQQISVPKNRHVKRKPVASGSYSEASTSTRQSSSAPPPQSHNMRSGASSRATSHYTSTTDQARASTAMSSLTQSTNDYRHSDSMRSNNRTWSLGSKPVVEPGRDLETQNPDYATIHTEYPIIPTLHPERVHNPNVPGSRNSWREPPRPESRGSIMSNIRNGIRDYIKPRPSAATTAINTRAQSRAESRTESRSHSRASSRPASRGSLSSRSGSWLRSASNGLRRKTSWTAPRAQNPNNEEEDLPRGRRDTRPDLNRSLPPLPGLDQWKEPKIHIASLLAKAQEAPQQPQSPSVENRAVNLPHSSYRPTPAPPPPLPVSPPMSDSSIQSGIDSRTRIPFGETSPNGGVKPKVPKEHRWLDIQVQQRLQATVAVQNASPEGPPGHPALQESSPTSPHGPPGHPALRSEQEPSSPIQSLNPMHMNPTHPLSSPDKSNHPNQLLPAHLQPPFAHEISPALSAHHHQQPSDPAHAERMREEAIRQIARRPIVGERGESFRSAQSQEGDQARSLSALGLRERDGPRETTSFEREGAKSAGDFRDGEYVESYGIRPWRMVKREGTSGLRDEYRGSKSETDGSGISVGTEVGDDAIRRREETPKRGLRNRLSRLLGSSGGQGGNHGQGMRTVVAN